MGGRRLHGSRENADQTANYYAVTTGETKAVRQTPVGRYMGCVINIQSAK